MNKNVIFIGGGTVSHVRNHLALCAPAYGTTARTLAKLAELHLPKMNKILKLTKMAGGSAYEQLETNEDISKLIDNLIKNKDTKIIFMSAALCDFDGQIGVETSGKYAVRLKTADYGPGNSLLLPFITIKPADKIIGKIRQTRKDIFLVGFKTTCGATEDEQYSAGLDLCKKASCNLVFANDTKTRLNMVIAPEEARYYVSKYRDKALEGLMRMTAMRSNLTFTRSTVVDGQLIPWNSELVPSSLREVVDYCIEQNAYKPFNGSTAGHFAVKIDNQTFLTSIRKTNFNKLKDIGLVKIKTDGPDTVLAYGAKPSVGGQSQRIVFNDHPGLDCIVHFHSPIKPYSEVPIVSQQEFECGSHQCGQNTSKGLRQFGNLKAVYLDNHGPNIVFNRHIDPQEVIKFIEDNFDLSQKTGGFVSGNLPHVRNGIKKLIAKWNKIGYYAGLEGSDEPETGEQTAEDKALWDRDYAIFTIEFDLGVPLSNSAVLSIKEEILRNIDPQLNIKVYPDCREIEVYRTGAKPYKNYQGVEAKELGKSNVG